ncbi:hypothetical protein M0R89_02925 [Halorussus limi]|uniref:Uncharacterized protein n=1 Tax=Halorussus limi TaxID=2938695 RepID=A0A8U0HVT4_9EURY|nr:hypothetical protein [Halorussus limi]UPV75028.1 hypothetical protein M0R89_02925 [Halorussus limi]
MVMVLELLFGFVVLVAASYVGTTMALRGFFGRERYDGGVAGGNRPPENGDAWGTDDALGTDGAQRTDDARGDDVPRTGDVSDDEKRD